MDIYIDCPSGISGDMTLSAFIDLGAPLERLRNDLAALPLEGFELAVSRVSRNGIGAVRVEVLEKGGASPKHYSDIRSLIERSSLPQRARELALSAFARLAGAEALIHGCPVDKVHFHEIGCVDTIVDIVGAALCVEYLGVEKTAASPLPVGAGHVSCRHGILPVPAPATVALLKGVPVYGTGVRQELVTPTGAALITTLVEDFGPMPAMTMEKVGYGAGSREVENMPNLLRIVSGSFDHGKAGEGDHAQVVVETCIDDMTPEVCGYVTGRLFDDGASDVYVVPVYMKKNRPGIMIQVLCHYSKLDAIASRILTETTSIGVRYHRVDRITLDREEVEIATMFGPVKGKRVFLPGGGTRIAPEYESCREIAVKKEVPIMDVYRAAEQESGNLAGPSEG